MAEYLIGAKMQMLYGEDVVHPKNVNTPSEFADFQIGDAAIEVTLNYYRLEAGRFEDFVSYGLKSFAHEGVT